MFILVLDCFKGVFKEAGFAEVKCGLNPVRCPAGRCLQARRGEGGY